MLLAAEAPEGVDDGAGEGLLEGLADPVDVEPESADPLLEPLLLASELLPEPPEASLPRESVR